MAQQYYCSGEWAVTMMESTFQSQWVHSLGHNDLHDVSTFKPPTTDAVSIWLEALEKRPTQQIVVFTL